MSFQEHKCANICANIIFLNQIYAGGKSAIFFANSYHCTLNICGLEPHKKMQSMPKTPLQKTVTQIYIQVIMSLLLSALTLKVVM